MIISSNYESPVGRLLITEENGLLNGLYLSGQRYFPYIPKNGSIEKETDIIVQAKNWLDRYFSGKRPQISDLALSPYGGEFRQTVYKLLCEIPYGETVTYGEIAKKAAVCLSKERMSAQAVGGAVGHNPISIIIPCHRVVGKDGSLTGYAGGLDVKRQLLLLEGVDISKLI